MQVKPGGGASRSSRGGRRRAPALMAVAGAGLMGLFLTSAAVSAPSPSSTGVRSSARVSRFDGGPAGRARGGATSLRSTGATSTAGRTAATPEADASTTGAASSPVPNPQVTGPVTGGARGYPYDHSLIDLASHGYTEQEYLISGTADAHGDLPVLGNSTGLAPPSGNQPAAYTTRILVRRPTNPARFNGTVLFEWLNVTSGVSIDLDWATAHREMMRDGYAWVGVDAQQVGVQTLKAWDPVRYATLSHPGDQYAYDIYSQAVQAVRHPVRIAPLGRLGPVRAAIADGHSQSGTYLHNYVNLVQNQAKVIDGFLIRGDGNPVFNLSQLKVPVFHYMSETEVNGITAQDNGTHAPDAADSRFYTLWQVAGPAHQDNYENSYFEDQLPRYWTAAGPAGTTSAAPTWSEQTAGNYGQEDNPVGNCQNGISTGIDSPATAAVAPYDDDAPGVSSIDEYPQQYPVDAAIYYLNRWIRTGAHPPSAPRITLDPSGTIARDRYGNARGGLRLPVVDVPVATYNGSSGCSLSGETFPLNSATLTRLYPTHAVYVAEMKAAIAKAEQSGFLLPFDGADLMGRAEAASIPPAG